MRSWQIIAAMCLLMIHSAQAQPEGPEVDLAAEVARLVRELDANELARRQAAEEALVALGPEAIPHLPEITPRTAGEVKVRLGRVRTALEMAVAASEGMAGGERSRLGDVLAAKDALDLPPFDLAVAVVMQGLRAKLPQYEGTEAHVLIAGAVEALEAAWTAIRPATS